MFLGNGQLIHPSDLTLGGCAALHAADYVLHFRAQLPGCGSTLTVRVWRPALGVLARQVAITAFCFFLQMTEDALVYSFSLAYSPTPIGNTAILKTSSAQVVIECHYRR